MDEKQIMEQKIRDLESSLSCNSSPIGDWKVTKCMEYQLAGKELGQRLLLPCCMFRSGEEVFLDDITRQQVQNTLQVPVNIVKSGGQDLVYGILGLEETEEGMEGSGFYEGYELRE